MIDAITSMMSYVVKRGELGMTFMKQNMQAEEAIMKMLMDVAKNIEQLNGNMASSGGGFSIYA